MNGTLSSSSEWMQLYQQTIDSSFSFADATALTTSCVTSPNNDFSPSSPSSAAAAGNHFNPRGASILKPVRRRSRASKRTPTTLLNTDAKNFRSLVQQFTGCGRRRSTSISFGNTRGPVNINFAPGADQHDYRSCSSIDHASLSSQPFVEKSYSCPLSRLQQQQHHQQPSSEEQECKFCFDSVTTDDFLLTSCFPRSSSSSSGSEIPQGLVMDDMYFVA